MITKTSDSIKTAKSPKSPGHSRIFIIDDDPSFRLCLAQIIQRPCASFDNVIDAVSALNEELPHLIFLDILLSGPNAFTLLNELASYSDLASIPIVLMSNLPAPGDLTNYGVVGFLDKATATPSEIRAYVQRYCA